MSLMLMAVSGWLHSRMSTRQSMRVSPMRSSARRGCDTQSTCRQRQHTELEPVLSVVLEGGRASCASRTAGVLGVHAPARGLQVPAST